MYPLYKPFSFCLPGSSHSLSPLSLLSSSYPPASLTLFLPSVFLPYLPSSIFLRKQWPDCTVEAARPGPVAQWWTCKDLLWGVSLSSVLPSLYTISSFPLPGNFSLLLSLLTTHHPTHLLSASDTDLLFIYLFWGSKAAYLILPSPISYSQQPCEISEDGEWVRLVQGHLGTFHSRVLMWNTSPSSYSEFVTAVPHKLSWGSWCWRIVNNQAWVRHVCHM